LQYTGVEKRNRRHPGLRRIDKEQLESLGCRETTFIEMVIPIFEQYIGIDYSGAEVPTASLKGLRVYLAERVSAPVEVPPHQARASIGRDAGWPSG